MSLVLAPLPLLGFSAPLKAIVYPVLFVLLICLAPSGSALSVPLTFCMLLRWLRPTLAGLVGLLRGLLLLNFGPVVGRRFAGLGSLAPGSVVSFMVATFTSMFAGLLSLLVLLSGVIVGTLPPGPSVLALPPMLCTVGCSPKAGLLSVLGFGPMLLRGFLLTSCPVVLPLCLVGSVLLNTIFALDGGLGVGASGWSSRASFPDLSPESFRSMSWSSIRTWALSSGAANSVALRSPASFRVRRPELSVCPWPNCTHLASWDHLAWSCPHRPSTLPRPSSPCLLMLMILLRFLVSRLGFASAKSKFGGFATLLRAPLRFLRFVSHQRFLFWKFAST